MALILNIETATTNCSVALALDGNLIAIKEVNDKNYSHSERLHIFIQDVLSEANIDIKQLDAVAVSKGPGSYTGLRIGVSASKGLCFALDIPLIAIPTLELLAHKVNIDKGYVVPMLDARRMEVYTAIFDSNHNWVKPTEAKILDDASFSELLDKAQVHFIGNGVEKSKSLINHENAIFVDGRLPSAKEMCQLSYHKYQISDTEDVAYFEPFYLKDFIALKPKQR